MRSRLKNSSSSEYVFEAMSEEDLISVLRVVTCPGEVNSGSHMVSPNFLFKLASLSLT